MKYLRIEEIPENSILAKDVFNDTSLIIEKDVVLTKKILNRLKEANYHRLWIKEEKQLPIIEKNIIDSDLRKLAVNNLKDLNIGQSIIIANKIVRRIEKHKDIVIVINRLKNYSNYTYQHCINVSVLATVLGIKAGLDTNELVELSTAALLHDIGKKCIDINIINKPGKLTEAEMNIMRSHPRYAYNLLKDNNQISETIRNGILHHHENEDGSGYPDGIKGDKIEKFAKIIHIVDVYDALNSKRPYKDAMTNSQSLEYLMGGCYTLFDYDLVNTFLKSVPAYLPGTRVVLSTGANGIVCENFSGNLVMRPKVKVLGKIIDLSSPKYANITIVN